VGGSRASARAGQKPPVPTRVVRVALLLACLATAAAGAAFLAGQPRAAVARATVATLLPDLNPLEPRRVSLEQYDGHWAVAFGSGTDNLGGGPLVVHGSRPDGNTQNMTASQTVMRSDGTSVVYPNVGTIVFEAHPDHQHWHFRKFLVYELRDAKNYRFVRPSQKTGFCLMDDYDSSSYDPSHNPPNKPHEPVYTQRCQLGNPAALSVDEGVSVGYGDYYNALLEGQSIDLGGVPDGRYYLVIRANPDRLLHESDYSNDASSVQLELSHPSGPSGPPSMTILKTCRDGGRCPVAVSLSVRAPKRVGHAALTIPVTSKVSQKSTLDIRLRVAGKTVAKVRRAARAGTSKTLLRLPRSLRRPASGAIVVRVSGPGLETVKRALRVIIR
jgi:hypothetical protein